jgi:hypothetical protein
MKHIDHLHVPSAVSKSWSVTQYQVTLVWSLIYLEQQRLPFIYHSRVLLYDLWYIWNSNVCLLYITQAYSAPVIWWSCWLPLGSFTKASNRQVRYRDISIGRDLKWFRISEILLSWIYFVEHAIHLYIASMPARFLFRYFNGKMSVHPL